MNRKKMVSRVFQDSEDKYRALIENIPQKIFVKDTNSAYVSCNKNLARDLKIRPEEIAGKTDYDFFPKELAKKYRADDKRIMRSGKIEDIEEEYVVMGFSLHEARKTAVHTVKAPIKDKKGKVIGIVGIFRDITARKKMEGELAEYRTKLEQKVKDRTKELEKSNSLLKDEIKKRDKAEKRLKNLVSRDPLTAVYNYFYFEEAIEKEIARAKRHTLPLSVVMLDIDYFKSVNDAYGRKFGDIVLKQFAAKLKRAIRRSDSAARYGGAEFIILCPETDRAKAVQLAQRVSKAVRMANFGSRKYVVKLKLSISVCSYPEDVSIGAAELVDICGKILDIAKERGGNRICSSADIEDKNGIVIEKISDNPEVKWLKKKINQLSNRASQSVIEAIFALARTIELKDSYTGEHVEDTVRYATRTARALDLPHEEVEKIARAAVLHDLGKIGVSEKILGKKAHLNHREFDEIKKHPQIGADILRPIHYLHDVIPLILYHHERWDGKGYPHGLKKEHIPIGARIISVADAYQALTSSRSYRKAYSKARAIKILKEESGTKYDPRIVKTFLQIIKQRRKRIAI